MPRGVYKRTEEHKKNIGLSMLGKNRGKVRTKEHLENYSKASKIRQKRLWQDSKYRDKQLESFAKGQKDRPNKPEKFLLKLLQELFPNQWEYVGDFQKWINGSNPDFININGQKKIIEMNGDFWHSERWTGRTKEEEEQQRIDCFAQAGYQTLIIWQHELENLDLLIEKITYFHSM